MENREQWLNYLKEGHKLVMRSLSVKWPLTRIMETTKPGVD